MRNDNMNENEQIIMDIIVNGGNARAKSIEAIREARAGHMDAASNYMEEANTSIVKAHQIQTTMIQDEAKGNHHEMTLLMVHAQDHLMNAMTVYELAKEIIEDYKTRERK